MSAQDAVLPTVCPSWCHGGVEGHQQAVQEGCDPDSARVHHSADLVGRALPAWGWVSSWDVILTANPSEGGEWYGRPVIEVECFQSELQNGSTKERQYLYLDTGSARVLARQLLHFADLADLESS